MSEREPLVIEGSLRDCGDGCVDAMTALRLSSRILALLSACALLTVARAAAVIPPGAWYSLAKTWEEYARLMARIRELKAQAAMSVGGWTMFPARVPLRLRVAFGWCVHTHDLSNLLKGVEDAGNGVIWRDDRWIDEIVTSREAWDNKGLELWAEAI